MASAAGAKIGEVVVVDFQMTHRIWVGQFVRVKVLFDTTTLLVIGFMFQRPNREDVWIQFKYERVSDFCFNSSRLGHVTQVCLLPVMNRTASAIYGPKMKAEFTSYRRFTNPDHHSNAHSHPFSPNSGSGFGSVVGRPANSSIPTVPPSSTSGCDPRSTVESAVPTSVSLMIHAIVVSMTCPPEFLGNIRNCVTTFPQQNLVEGSLARVTPEVPLVDQQKTMDGSHGEVALMVPLVMNPNRELAMVKHTEEVGGVSKLESSLDSHISLGPSTILFDDAKAHGSPPRSSSVVIQKIETSVEEFMAHDLSSKPEAKWAPQSPPKDWPVVLSGKGLRLNQISSQRPACKLIKSPNSKIISIFT